jgi:hypothetical protein
MPTMTDLRKARDFMQTHARLLDRRRFDLLFGDGDAEGALGALAGYRNADGGFGWALEPDLRSPTSQPAGALHAFEVLEEVAPATSPCAAPLCDWLASISLDDGGMPFALAGADDTGSASFWAEADHTRSSLHITSAVAGMAHRVAVHDPVVREHPWLERATDYCLRTIAALERPPFAIEFMFMLQFLDAVHETRPEAASQLERLRGFLPESGALSVAGGIEGETLHPLDVSPLPDRPLRALFADDLIERDLDRLAAEQRDDGGWDFDFARWTPAAELDWRGYVTVRALTILRAHGRLA